MYVGCMYICLHVCLSVCLSLCVVHNASGEWREGERGESGKGKEAGGRGSH